MGRKSIDGHKRLRKPAALVASLKLQRGRAYGCERDEQRCSPDGEVHVAFPIALDDKSARLVAAKKRTGEDG